MSEREGERRQPASLPRVPLVLLRLLMPRAERDEVLADLSGEYERQVESFGSGRARRWLWGQALGSAPALLRWSWWRNWTGFEPRANAFHPGGYVLGSFFADLRYAARRLTARPTYSILSVLTLALGIGGTAAVFGIARGLLFEPLPYANARDVAVFWMSGSWYEAEFAALRGHFPGFQKVALYREGGVTLRDGDAPARLVPAIRASTELFDVLGARPLLGRAFLGGEDAQGAEPVAVLSYGLWQELGGDRSILGTRVMLDGAPRTVVGVMPRGFWYPSPAVRVWLPQEIDPLRRNGSFTLIGQVGPGHDARSMQAPVARLTQMLGERFTYSVMWDKTKNAYVKPLREHLLGPMRPSLLAMLAAMGLILLIGCVNVAALMLGQVEGRTTELAVRSALGADRARLARQLVVEAVVVGVIAAALGAALAAAGYRVLAEALPLGAWAEGARFDWRVFATALVVSLGAALMVAAVPVTALWRGDLRGALSGTRTGGIQGRGGRIERGLVVTEVALAMLIASGAALLVRSVGKLYAIDPGIETDGVVVVDILAGGELTPEQRRQALGQMTDAVRALPGVRSASVAMKIPLRGSGNSFDITIPGQPEAAQTTTYFRVVGLDYFGTMGIRLRAGRTFAASDVADSAMTEVPIVINEDLARRYFPGVDPIGRVVGGGFDAPQRIIGVVANVLEGDLTSEPEAARYYLAGTVSWFSPQAAVVIKAERPEDADAVLDAARATIQRAAPAFAVHDLTSMKRVLDMAVGPARQVMQLLALLSALALVLGAVGIYGVISHFAARRKRDWAIRMALGLPAGRVVRHIVGQGAALVAIGIVVGVAGTLALARLLGSFLYGVSAVDPLSFLAASATLMLAGVMAALVPAWRAGTVDPATALREQ
jgi:putative ABC transport system permease protein